MATGTRESLVRRTVVVMVNVVMMVLVLVVVGSMVVRGQTLDVLVGMLVRWMSRWSMRHAIDALSFLLALAVEVAKRPLPLYAFFIPLR